MLLVRLSIFLKKFLIAGFFERYFIKSSKIIITTTTTVIVTSIFLNDSAETKGKRPEPITVLAVNRMRTQKIVVLRLASRNFFQLTF